MSNKVSQIRFNGYSDPWEERKSKDLFTPINERNREDLPVLSVTQDQGVVLRNDLAIDIKYDKSTLSSYKVIHPGDFVISLRSFQGGFELSKVLGISSPAYTIFDLKNLTAHNKLYWKYIFKSFKFIESLKTVTFGIRDGKSISFREFSDLKINYPSDVSEQEKIGSFFKQLDDTIAIHQRKLDLLKEQKKGYLQKMFPKNGAKVPELRFAGFADDWEERKLSSGLREYTDRVIVEDDKEYYQISVRNNFGGITLRGSKMGNKIGRKRQAKINLTKYPQTLIFTRQTVEQGGIGWVDKYCDGAIVTENMPTISLDTSVFSKYFLTNLFQTRIFYKNAILDNVEGGSAQIAVHESKFLSSTLLFPNLDEQEKIGQFFKQLDNTIALHQRKLDLLREQKKGYLQKMFV